jgi:hypothetical protein
VENWFWKKLWTWRTTLRNELINEFTKE